MDNRELAGELVKIAKELVASKVQFTWYGSLEYCSVGASIDLMTPTSVIAIDHTSKKVNASHKKMMKDLLESAKSEYGFKATSTKGTDGVTLRDGKIMVFSGVAVKFVDTGELEGADRPFDRMKWMMRKFGIKPSSV